MLSRIAVCASLLVFALPALADPPLLQVTVTDPQVPGDPLVIDALATEADVIIDVWADGLVESADTEAVDAAIQMIEDQGGSVVWPTSPEDPVLKFSYNAGKLLFLPSRAGNSYRITVFAVAASADGHVERSFQKFVRALPEKPPGPGPTPPGPSPVPPVPPNPTPVPPAPPDRFGLTSTASTAAAAVASPGRPGEAAKMADGIGAFSSKIAAGGFTGGGKQVQEELVSVFRVSVPAANQPAWLPFWAAVLSKLNPLIGTQIKGKDDWVAALTEIEAGLRLASR